MIHNAKNLTPDQKAAIESLLGRPVTDGESISIVALPPVEAAEVQRGEIAEKLKTFFAEVHAHRQEFSEQEAEEIINEAMASVRSGYPPLP